jgi:hypothetical protein
MSACALYGDDTSVDLLDGGVQARLEPSQFLDAHGVPPVPAVLSAPYRKAGEKGSRTRLRGEIVCGRLSLGEEKGAPMRDGEPNMYTALATMRNGYMQMQWSRVQMFLVFNTVALPLVFGTGQNDIVKLFVSTVGVGMHVLLLMATGRAEMWISYIDTRLSALERLDWDNVNAVRVRVFSHVDFEAKRAGAFASRKIFGSLGATVMIVWLWQAIHFALIAVR